MILRLSDYASSFSLTAKQDYTSVSQESLKALIRRREQLILLANQEKARLEKEVNKSLAKLINDHCKYSILD